MGASARRFGVKLVINGFGERGGGLPCVEGGEPRIMPYRRIDDVDNRKGPLLMRNDTSNSRLSYTLHSTGCTRDGARRTECG